MGLLYHSSGRPFHLTPKDYDQITQSSARKGKQNQQQSAPILLLRPDANEGKGQGTQEALQVESRGESPGVSYEAPETSDFASGNVANLHQGGTLPDGPWIRHPEQISEDCGIEDERIRDDATIEENRERHKEHVNKIRNLPKEVNDSMKILNVITVPKAVDMTDINGVDEELVDLMVEQWYVNTPIYLQPGVAVPPSMRDHFHRDWSWNSRGVYYRHYYSPEWVTGDHSLWVPELDHLDWEDPTEETRRVRAGVFLKHALDNARWKKSEYAWEADAWTDVFGQMRDDPAIAAWVLLKPLSIIRSLPTLTFFQTLKLKPDYLVISTSTAQ